jgi:thiol-disulfide isomerase/thioredoxin
VPRAVFASALAAVTLGAVAGATPPAGASPDAAQVAGALHARLSFESVNPRWALKSQSAFVQLSPRKPDAVAKEPAYRASPLYGSFRIGNGAQQPYLVAVDEADAEQSWLYVDANRNGDLTDDPPVRWSNREQLQIGEERKTRFVAAASLAGAWKGKEDGAYRCELELSKIHGSPRLMVLNHAAWTGTLAVGESRLAVAVAATAEDLSDPQPGESRTALVMVDLDGDGTYEHAQAGPEGVNEIWRLDEVIELEGRRYEIPVLDDPAQLVLVPTVREASPGEPPPVLLSAGTVAPDFTVEGWQHGPLKLSDFRGQAVIIDFWATWCSACKATMPYVEQLYQDTREQGVVVLSICTADTRDKYDAWVSRRTDRYAFSFAYDTGGEVAKRYNARLLPTKYVIDREGLIVAAFIGGGGPDARIDRALERIGITRPDVSSAKAAARRPF